MEDRLEIRPATDAEGCLQDVHWAHGSFGYFPSYAIGAVISAQLHESLRAALPDLDAQIAAGDFSGVMLWLRSHVHGLAAREPLQDLMKQATGKPLGASALVRHLESRYLEAGV
jgi:carboxypeptidase Taq